MKKIFLSLFIVLGLFTMNAQSFELGVRGGINFGYDGTLKNTLKNIKLSSGKNSTGGTFGIYTKLDFSGLFIQPELDYSYVKTEYTSEDNSVFKNNNYNIDIPVLLGSSHEFSSVDFKFFAGPIFSTTLKDNITLAEIKEKKSDNFSVSGQVGIGFEFYKRLTVDARYEFGLNKKSTEFVNSVDNTKFNISKKSNTLMIGLNYRLF